MSSTRYTLNCDLGEGIKNEAFIIPFIDLASVACGGHFGDQDSILETLTLVKRFGKKAGAHPSYPDRENFGRKSMLIQTEVLIKSLHDQILRFFEVAEKESIACNHIKFHGALYNDAAENGDLALALVQFLVRVFPEIPLFIPPHSEIQKVAKKLNHPFKLEVFGDRAYRNDYKLLSRSVENSLFTQKKQVISHMKSILEHKQIQTATGDVIPIEADTICFHGDNPGIIEFLPFVRDQFWK
jgi:5-oxoprolinase (ATP-hydrolysing) subunit A